MDLGESCADLYDIEVNDDQLTMIHEANKNVVMKVKTPNGLTEEEELNEVVIQGDVPATAMASNQVDSFGKELLMDKPSYIYKYKNEFPIGVLGATDDLMGHQFGHTKCNTF